MAKHSGHTPRWIVFLIDILICLASITLSYFIKFEFRLGQQEIYDLKIIAPLVIFIRGLAFIAFRTYAGLIRYTGTKDAERIFMVISVSSFVIIVINFLSFAQNRQFLIPNSIIFIDYFLTTTALIGLRMVYKSAFYALTSTSINKENIIIVGTEQFAAAVKRAIDKDTISNLHVIAFIDPTNKQEGQRIEGIEIFSAFKLDHLLEKYPISKVIIAQKNFDPQKKAKIIDKCLSKKVSVQSIPDASAWINGELSLKQIKDIKIEELLEREPIMLDKKRIHSYIKGKVILVTGAAGSIGSEMVRQISKFQPKQIILFDQAETPLYDIELELKEDLGFFDYQIVIGSATNEYRVRKLFDVYKPEVVFHAAAYKHVPMMEGNPSEAIFNNIKGTKIIADISVEYNVEKFVMISTDKAVNPTNIMGASKRIAEIYTQTLNKTTQTGFITTRFGNVLGSNGSVIPRFKKQIEHGGPVTITHPEVTRFFMTIPEACQLVLEAGAMGQGGEIFIFDMGEPVKILDLALKMIKLSGLEVGKDIQINYTGLRPGEKLYEELLNNKESTTATYHPKIMIAKVRDYNPEDIFRQIDDLIADLPNHNNFALVTKMKDIVPEFISKNSVFEGIDKQKKFSDNNGQKSINVKTA